MSETLTMTATEANRKFSALLREVERGKRVIITSHGRDVAMMSSPESQADIQARKLKALAALKAHWAVIKPVTVGPWTRDELYERD
jgi:prevent-host-death family protein